MRPDTERKKIVVIGLLTFVVLFVGILWYFLGRNQSTEEKGPPPIDSAVEDSFFDPAISATIVEDDPQLEKQLGYADDTFMAVTMDLHTFGRRAYKIYGTDKKTSSRPIGFKITSGVKKENNIVTFEGHYGSSKNKVTVRIEILSNDRITISVTDTVTKLNIDSDLPSNSKINQFIGRLPIKGEGYNITYVSDGVVNVGLYFRDPSLLDRAYQDITNRLGKEDFEKLEISASFPSEGF